MDPTYSAYMANSFGEQLKALREAGGMTQAELAIKVGKSEPYVSNLETGHRRAPRNGIQLWADALGLHGRIRIRFIELAMATHLPAEYQPVYLATLKRLDRLEAQAMNQLRTDG